MAINSLRSLICILVFLISKSAFAVGDSANPPKTAPLQMRSGAYLTSLYDLNSNNNTFTADLWLWFLHDKSRELNPLKTLEMVNTRDIKASLSSTQEQGAERYHTEKVHGVFNYNWDVTNFPFDHHELQIRMEDGFDDASKLAYIADSANTSFDPSIKIEGWRIDRVAMTVGSHNYNSSFGISGATGSTYPSSVFSIFIRRDASGLFWKLLAAVYIAFLGSIISYFMDPEKDGRVGLLIGMTFAVVMNSQRVASTLGQTGAFTLADKIHILTLLSILFTMVFALVARHLHATGRGKFAKRLDLRVAVSTIVIYTVLNIFMVVSAMPAA